MRALNLSKKAIFFVGFYQCFNPLIQLGNSYYNYHFNEASKGHNNYKRLQDRYGRVDNEDKPVALITGASEGIGREFALELAKSGFDIVIASRSQEKLDNAAEIIRAEVKGANVKSLPIDFAHSQPEDIRKFFDQATEGNQNLRILVNNVGIIKRNRFLETDPQILNDMILINVFAQVYMTKYFQSYIKKQTDALNTRIRIQRNQRYAMIHLSSILSEFKMTKQCLYSSTKRFNAVFSNLTGFWSSRGSKFYTERGAQCLSQVDNIFVMPGRTSTAMNNFQKGKYISLPNETAEGSLRDLGFRRYTYGSILHSQQGNLLKMMPDSLTHLRMAKEGKQVDEPTAQKQ
ncbi:short chain dehydrogenase reductase family protein [Stylonychia lemnae]|uniref:Short chain dehydrogenase reductase family protein n=1 Tax=Stylonychia lemnae TaxID=5949 RepID=A0A078AGA3_STYLE|nr:short chain dehydrogenase reductase family protein [Stylonychia lemnae]|eukprot:CDW81330.1 short chain dehydrogenase reductase family protein [Stylonychia lemnae]